MELKIPGGYYLSEITAGDKQALMTHLNEKEINNNSLRLSFPCKEAEVDSLLEYIANRTRKNGRATHWGIRNSDGYLIGAIGLYNFEIGKSHHAEIGYWLSKLYCGRGIMTEALRTISRLGLNEFNLQRISAQVFSSNLVSMHLLEKVGYVYEGTLRGSQVGTMKKLFALGLLVVFGSSFCMTNDGAQVPPKMDSKCAEALALNSLLNEIALSLRDRSKITGSDEKTDIIFLSHANSLVVPSEKKHDVASYHRINNLIAALMFSEKKPHQFSLSQDLSSQTSPEMIYQFMNSILEKAPLMFSILQDPKQLINPLATKLISFLSKKGVGPNQLLQPSTINFAELFKNILTRETLVELFLSSENGTKSQWLYLGKTFPSNDSLVSVDVVLSLANGKATVHLFLR